MSWTARDRRQLSAFMLMALSIVHLHPRNHHAFRLGQSAAGLIGLFATLGRRSFRLRVGDKAPDMTGGEAERVLASGDAA